MVPERRLIATSGMVHARWQPNFLAPVPGETGALISHLQLIIKTGWLVCLSYEPHRRGGPQVLKAAPFLRHASTRVECMRTVNTIPFLTQRTSQIDWCRRDVVHMSEANPASRWQRKRCCHGGLAATMCCLYGMLMLRVNNRFAADVKPAVDGR
jgi:hypothetical protein